jgi:hypothetical protein
MNNQYKNIKLTQGSNCFKIFKQTYFDNNGLEYTKYYFIKQRKMFLGMEWWKDVRHRESGYGDSYMARTEFSTVDRAEVFIKNVLCPGVPRDKFIEVGVKSIECQS